MKGLLNVKSMIVAVAACALVLPGVAMAAPGDDEAPVPSPTPAPVGVADDWFSSYSALGGAYDPTARAVQVPDTEYQAPALQYGAPVLLSAPQSLVVYRGSAVILSLPNITTDVATLEDGVWQLNPAGVTPAWITNKGSAAGTAMTTMIIAGHNVYGGVESPLNHLGSVQPGDMIDVTLASGKVVRFQTNDGAVPLPKLRQQQESLRTLSLQTCSPDGAQNIVVEAVAVSL